MALGFSTCLRNKMLGGVPVRHVALISAATIAAVDGGGAADTFTDSGNGFLTAGFSIGDAIMVFGFTGANLGSHGPFVLTDVAAGTLTVPTGSIIAADGAGETVTIVALVGGSIKDIFKDGVLRFYNGTRPASPDAGLGGATPLVSISKSSIAFTGGAVGGGLEFGIPAAASMGIASGEVWSGKAVAAGIAGFFRLYANPADAGAADGSFIYPRIDGTIATSGGDINMTSTSIRLDATITVDEFTLTLPVSV